MFMLAPVPWAQGFSILQVMVLMVMSWSIGLADNVWETGVQYVAQHGGSVQPATNVPGIRISNETLKGMLDSSVTAAALVDAGYTVTPYYQPLIGLSGSLSAFGTAGFSGAMSAAGSAVGAAGISNVASGNQTGFVMGFQATSGSGGTIPPSAIGTISVNCSPWVCAGVMNGIQAVMSTVMHQAALDAMSWATSVGQNGTVIPPGLFAQAQSAYANAVQTGIGANFTNAGTAYANALNQFYSNASNQGWAGAGVYFYQLSDFNKMASDVTASVTYSPGDSSMLNGINSAALTNAISLADSYAATEAASGPASSGNFGSSGSLAAAGAQAAPGGDCPDALSSSASIWSMATCWASAPLLRANSAIINAMAGGGITAGGLGQTGIDAISSVQTASNLGLDAALTIPAWYAGVRAAAATAFNAARNESAAATAIPVLGSIAGAATGLVAAIPAGADAAIKAISPMVWTAAAMGIAFFSVGAYYLPLMPAIVFELAVIGWMVMGLEMLIAAPLWAFSHILPEGDGMLGSAARAGYFHMLDILGRPVLLIFGLFLTILMMNVSVWYIGTGLQIAFASEMSGSVVGPLSAIAELVIIMTSIYLVTNKSVHLITMVPRTVMRWLGQSMGVDYGDAEQHAHQSLQMFGGRFGGGVKDVGRQAAGAADKAQRAPGNPGAPAEPAQKSEGSGGGGGSADASSVHDTPSS